MHSASKYLAVVLGFTGHLTLDKGVSFERPVHGGAYTSSVRDELEATRRCHAGPGIWNPEAGAVPEQPAQNGISLTILIRCMTIVRTSLLLAVTSVKLVSGSHRHDPSDAARSMRFDPD
jgi:hypothetical protein